MCCHSKETLARFSFPLSSSPLDIPFSFHLRSSSAQGMPWASAASGVPGVPLPARPQRRAPAAPGRRGGGEAGPQSARTSRETKRLRLRVRRRLTTTNCDSQKASGRAAPLPLSLSRTYFFPEVPEKSLPLGTPPPARSWVGEREASQLIRAARWNLHGNHRRLLPSAVLLTEAEACFRG